jgi:hypothetical protein
MIQKNIHIAPKVDAISPLGVTDKPSTGGALFLSIMKEIQLTKGFVALVDDEDHATLNKHKWHVSEHRGIYAVRWIGKKDGLIVRKRIYMQCEIMENYTTTIDHKDGNGLNNQKSNLRFCTIAENLRNRRKIKNKTSKYIGVYWDKQKINGDVV